MQEALHVRHERMSSVLHAARAGMEERGATYEQAVKLGGGYEALLGLAEGSLRPGRPCSGPVYAAARRSLARSTPRSCHKNVSQGFYMLARLPSAMTSSGSPSPCDAEC